MWVGSSARQGLSDPTLFFLMQQTPRAVMVRCDGCAYDVDVDVDVDFAKST